MTLEITRRGFVRIGALAAFGAASLGTTGSLLSSSQRQAFAFHRDSERATGAEHGGGQDLSTIVASEPADIGFIQRDETVVARLFVGSDLHVGYGRKDWTEHRELRGTGKTATKKALRAFDTLAGSAPDIDGILLAGDLAYANLADELDSLLTEVVPAIAQSFTAMPAVQLSMGNHDCWHSSLEKFEADFGEALAKAQDFSSDAWQSLDLGQKQNSLAYVAGVPVIKLAPQCPANEGAEDNILLSDYSHLYNFLKQSLAEAAAARPDMPIIVMAHHGFAQMPSTGEYWGDFGEGSHESDSEATAIDKATETGTTAEKTDATSGNLIELMANYPQILFFSGHVHNDLHDSDFYYSGAGFNAFACATLGAYIEDLDDDSVRSDSQGLLIDIFNDGSSAVHRLDFANEQEILPVLHI